MNYICSNLHIKLDEYSKVTILIETVKNDKNIQIHDKIKFLNHIENIFIRDNNKKHTKDFFLNCKSGKIKIKKESQNKINEKLCKKCKKHKFKKYNYCYKHCQEEDIIPNNIKRKDYNDYLKTKK